MSRPLATLRSPLRLACLATLAAAWLACAAVTPISEVRARSGELEGKEVTIKGNVADTLQLPFLGSRFYQVDDGTGQLWVQTNAALPPTGEVHRVTGVLQPGFKAGTFEAGLMLQESRRD